MGLIELFPSRVPIGFIEAQGTRMPVMASAEFIRTLQKVLERIGGPLGTSTTDLSIADDEDSGTEEFKSEATKLMEALAFAPLSVFEQYTDPLHPIVQQHSEVQQVQTELAGLREEVSRLRSIINDIQQGPNP